MNAMMMVRCFHSIGGCGGGIGGAVSNRKLCNSILIRTSSSGQRILSQSTIVQQRPYHASRRVHQLLSDNNNNTEDDKRKKTVLVLGSNGALGSCIVSHLKEHNPNCHVIGADIIASSSTTTKNNDYEEDVFISLSSSSSTQSNSLTKALVKGMKEITSDRYLDAIICASGGFAMDDDNYNKDDVPTKMMKLNYYPVVAAAEMAKKYMAPKGLFVVIGAAAALVPGPGIGAYCASKAAAHYYVQTLGAMSGVSLQHKNKEYFPDDYYLDELTAVAILPTILDTPTNRRVLLNNDDDDDDNSKNNDETSTWIPLSDIATQISLWLYQPYYRPHSGSIIKATKSMSTNFNTNSTTMFTLVR